MKAKLLACLLLAGGFVFAADFSVGVRIGPPPPPRVVAVRPPAPGPDWLWVDGYWYPAGNRYLWHEGYWSRAPYPGARWVIPRYDGERFYEGYWEGDRGRFRHDHRWDRDRDRDYDRERHERDRDHDRH
jgi:YXWGXW repeat-containing protein